MAKFNPWWNELKHDKNLLPFINKSITHYGNEEIESVKAYSFKGCTALESVSIPNATSIGSNTFDGCTSLTDVNISSVTLLNGVFLNCAFTRLILPSVVTTGNTLIGGGVATSCTNLSVVDFHKSITMNKGGLSNINPFNGDTNLYNIILRGDTMSTMSKASMLAGTPFATAGSGAHIYVPSALVESYKTATNWSTYAEFFTALEGSIYEDPDWWKNSN